jgi:excisionase family DNA binding protein
MTDDPLLRPSQAAKALGVTRETVWRWIKKGIVSVERVGPFQKVRIRTSVVEAMRSTWNSA